MGQVLFNLLIVLSPIYFYNLIFTHSTKKRTEFLAGLAFGLMSILSMNFPIISGEIQWNLSWVPLVICALYMGGKSILICGVLVIGYSYYLGKFILSVNALVVALILLILIMLIKKKYHHTNNNKKFIAILCISIVTFFIVITASELHYLYMNQVDLFYQQGFELYLLMGVTYVIGILINAYFIESILSNLKLVEQVHNAEKMNMMSELAASIAHEIQNPLTAVRGFIQLTKVKVDKDLHHYIDTAIDELDKTELIISDYLNLAIPKQNSEMKEFNINKALKEVILLVQSYANIKGIKLDHFIEKNIYITVDPITFKQAILNLVKNAITATDDGSVKIVTSYCKKTDKINIKIIDTGAGMDTEQLQILGKPYITTKTYGTGLGLLVTFRLIDSMGGNLTFESSVNKGTTACIELKGIKKP